jgi:hypothetical protein
MGQCSQYYALQEGSMSETTNFDAEGKENGHQTITVTGVTTKGDQEIYTLSVETFDEKGKSVVSGLEAEMICEDGALKVDIGKTMQSYAASVEGVKVRMEGDKLYIPANMEVGQTLPDSQISLIYEYDKDSPYAAMMGEEARTDTRIHDRKVVSKETVTTKAGTFECLKITEKSTTETKGMGQLIVFSTVDYISTNGYGSVKKETYDQDGKLTGTSELTAYKKIK